MYSVQWRHPRRPWSTFQGSTRRYAPQCPPSKPCRREICLRKRPPTTVFHMLLPRERLFSLRYWRWRRFAFSEFSVLLYKKSLTAPCIDQETYSSRRQRRCASIKTSHTAPRAYQAAFRPNDVVHYRLFCGFLIIWRESSGALEDVN